MNKNAHAFVDFDIATTEELVQLATPKNPTDLVAKLSLLILVLTLYSSILAFARGVDKGVNQGLEGCKMLQKVVGEAFKQVK